MEDVDDFVIERNGLLILWTWQCIQLDPSEHVAMMISLSTDKGPCFDISPTLFRRSRLDVKLISHTIQTCQLENPFCVHHSACHLPKIYTPNSDTRTRTHPPALKGSFMEDPRCLSDAFAVNSIPKKILCMQRELNPLFNSWQKEIGMS